MHCALLSCTTLWSSVVDCAMLCHSVLCYITAVLCNAVPCNTVLHWTVQCSTVLYYTVVTPLVSCCSLCWPLHRLFVMQMVAACSAAQILNLLFRRANCWSRSRPTAASLCTVTVDCSQHCSDDPPVLYLCWLNRHALWQQKPLRWQQLAAAFRAFGTIPVCITLHDCS